MRIIYEDDDLIVLDKPAGVLSAPLSTAPGGDRGENVFDMLKAELPGRGRGAERERGVWIIHRLDRFASGLMVFAKTEHAFAWLKEELRAHRIDRRYAALVEGLVGEIGEPAAEAGWRELRGLLAEERPGKMRALRGAAEREDAQPAVTRIRVAAHGAGRTLLECRLETGRKNQIRVQLAAVGHPVVGDRKYGPDADISGDDEAAHARPRAGVPRLCLHATRLSFTHPTSGRAMDFASDLPPLFERVLGTARVVPAEAPPQAPEPEPEDHANDDDERPAPAPLTAPADVASPAKPGKPPTATPTPGDRPGGLQEPPAETSWDHVAPWYDKLLEERGSDHHERVILPGVARLVQAGPGRRVLDVACGQGLLCRRLASLGCEAVGVDAAPQLVEFARSARTPGCRYEVGDARALDRLGLGAFDAASCVLAFMNIDPVEPVMRGIAAALKPGGVLVGVILHPAFRAPGQTSWGWDRVGTPDDGLASGQSLRLPGKRTATQMRQYRRVDGYLSPARRQIVMNPGHVSSGDEAVVTWTFHRPIGHYVRCLAESNLLVDAMEEWPSLRVSQPGPRAAEENRSRREIPLFLAFRAVKINR